MKSVARVLRRAAVRGLKRFFPKNKQHLNLSILVAMDFRVPGFSVEMQHNQLVYPTPSASSACSNHTNFFDQAMEGGPVDTREVIQRELEKEMIREKIIAEEVERFNVLEAEVRRELMMGREMMAKKSEKGFSSSFMSGLQSGESHDITTSLLKVGMGNLNLYGLTPPESKLKPSPSFPAARRSSELNSCNSKKMEWRCSICKISASSERGLLEHLAGQKHHVKAASIVINNSPKYGPSLSNKMEWRCPICEVSAPCERGLQDHLAGKKHQAKVTALRADNAEKAMKSVENSSESVPNDSKEDEKTPPPQPPPSLPTLAGSSEPLKKKMEWRCPICKVSSSSEIDLQNHLAGKKHKAKVAIVRKGKNI
ncbi:unnamed protein product [Lactuca saligna]|uniref:C2H2-type domain-containing protein n=1 Tax=Lactuca saligna TaxID=75948 RepID=A0AA35Z515_LACSI|nr:unnamed protein product [Lactuca saligna]